MSSPVRAIVRAKGLSQIGYADLTILCIRGSGVLLASRETGSGNTSAAQMP
jgi:hypothetical protein